MRIVSKAKPDDNGVQSFPTRIIHRLRSSGAVDLEPPEKAGQHLTLFAILRGFGGGMGPVALLVFKTSEPANTGLVGSTPTRLRQSSFQAL